MQIRSVVLLFVLALFSSCDGGSGETVHREDTPSVEEKTLFTNDNVQVLTRSRGLPEGARMLYLSRFSDLTTNTEALKLQDSFDFELRAGLQLQGYILIDRIRSAHAVISGSIDLFTADEGARITNIPSLLYTLSLTYSVTGPDHEYIQQDRRIREQLLVLDTNRILSNQAAEYLVKRAGKHAAEAVISGWQQDFTRTAERIDTLGGATNETSSASDRY